MRFGSFLRFRVLVTGRFRRTMWGGVVTDVQKRDEEGGTCRHAYNRRMVAGVW